MRGRRWSDNDHNFGPFTFARGSTSWNFSLMLKSAEEEYPGCCLRITVGTYTCIVWLPDIIPAYREKVKATYWDDQTIQRVGQDWYWSIEPRQYGISLSDGDFLQIFYGRQPPDGNSRDEQRWSLFLPWMQQRHVRHSLYGLNGEHFIDEPKRVHYVRGTVLGGMNYEEWKSLEDLCPTRTFSFLDFDGEQLTAKTRIEEREWRLGTGWFKWLSIFRKPTILRSLDIEFSGETGRRKGSWKGGTVGHSIEMLPGELHEAAFKRYCEGDDRMPRQKRDMKFIEEV